MQASTLLFYFVSKNYQRKIHPSLSILHLEDSEFFFSLLQNMLPIHKKLRKGLKRAQGLFNGATLLLQNYIEKPVNLHFFSLSKRDCKTLLD